MSAGVADGLASAMLSATEAENRKGSCGTQAMWARNVASGRSGSGTPPSVNRPASGSAWRSSKRTKVDLPAPVAPTMPSVRPGESVSDTPSSAGRFAPGKLKVSPSARSVASAGSAALPSSASDSGASNTGDSRAHAARPRSSSASTQPAANIGQISWPRYIVNAVSWPMLISCRATSQPPMASAIAVARPSVMPTAGSYAASQHCERKAASAACSARSPKRRSLRETRPNARNVRTPARLSCTCWLRSPKRVSESCAAWCRWLETHQNASPISGNGTSAARPNRQSMARVIIASTSSSVCVPSKPASIASLAACSTASMSFVASAIRSPVRCCWK